jgi:hypothetical protein
VAHPPLCELGAATIGVEADDPQVAVGVALPGIGDLTLDDGDLSLDPPWCGWGWCGLPVAGIGWGAWSAWVTGERLSWRAC